MTKAQEKKLSDFEIKISEFEKKFMALEVKFREFEKGQRWQKLKMDDMHMAQHGIRDDIGGLIARLFNDKETGELGYLAVTADLQKKHYETLKLIQERDDITNKRIDKLEVVKKFVWASMVMGSGAIGWILKVIYDKV